MLNKALSFCLSRLSSLSSRESVRQVMSYKINSLNYAKNIVTIHVDYSGG